MNIDTRDQQTWHLIRVDGEVDLNTSPKLRKAILSGIDGSTHVGVDLAGASYMDSSGVATLVGLRLVRGDRLALDKSRGSI